MIRISFLVYLATLIVLASCDVGRERERSYVTLTHFLDGNVYVYPANENSPYGTALVTHLYGAKLYYSTPLHVLPFIGQEHDNPTIENVMDRVLISHDWMGERFEELIKLLPSDILELMKSVTGIVISCDVRPAYCTTFTGAIYLDPQYMWLTYEEKLTISQKEDYRSGFSDDLKYRTLKRYVKDNINLYEDFEWSSTEERSIEDIKYYFAMMLYHELGHANDFFPPHIVSSLSYSHSSQSAFNSIRNEIISEISCSTYFPLKSDVLKGLAQVKYGGAIPSASQKDITPEMVSDEFMVDLASRDYSYFTQYEDLANIFAAVMLNYHFDVYEDFAYTYVPGGHATLPINFDDFTYNVVFPFLNTSIFVNFLGTLNWSGESTAQLNMPAVPGFAGITMYYAYCCNNPFDFTSNPVQIEVVP